MSVRVGDIREILEQAAPGGAVEIPVSVLDGHVPDVGLVFRGGRMRVEGAVCDLTELRITGQAATTASASPVPVRIAFTGDGDRVTDTVAAADLGAGRRLLLVDGAAADAELPPGAWVVVDGRAMRLTVRGRAAHTDPGRLDGLGRPLPPARVRTAAERAQERRPQALVTERGIFVPRPTAYRQQGVRVLESPMVRGWQPVETPIGGGGISVEYEKSPVRVAGAFTAMPILAEDGPFKDYEAAFGGALLFDTGKFNGSLMGAYLEPRTSSVRPSLFAYGSLGSSVTPPPFVVRGVALGGGWNSRVRVPRAEDLGAFPFLMALDNPGAIGADGPSVDPLKVLTSLIGPPRPWVIPQEGDLWFAAGLAFDCFKTVRGRAMALVQTGSELTISLLGAGGAQLPTQSEKKIARLEIGFEVTVKPVVGELSISAGFTEKTFLIDENCKLRGGVGLKFWFGEHPQAGDFALILGALPRARELPGHYPKSEPAGLEWGIGNTIKISGTAYAAMTPKSLMAGGSLEIVFQAGMVRAWLTAKLDVLVEWNPFYFDVGIGVRIGVSATIKVWFFRLTISIEIGASVRVWGPAVGGEATVHLWFISFTFGFGAERRSEKPALGWGGFQGMLPQPKHIIRTVPGPGYAGESTPDAAADSDAKPWLVNSGGFTFTTDTQAPVSTLYLDRDSTTPVDTGTAVDILPMHVQGKESELRVWFDREGRDETLRHWKHTPIRGNVVNALWGTSPDGGGGDGLLRERIIGVQLVSPPVNYGTSTGFIDEKGISFDPIAPDGRQPLSADEDSVGAEPRRPGGVIEKIHDGIDAAGTRSNRSALVGALGRLGVELGPVDTDLSGYAGAAGTAFTASPMLVAAG
ncbi:hypothetical protein Spla01_01290 [Streptomyces platensis]|uniref:DUF6603 domain-containing protein n=1 Tax=Streptomyces platensis TaxID=58346 RepID=A0ABX3XM42_STRPT|nr:DUF6603 domain-containing protein [Streptomyces platensis]OSY36797.1 hypothetical protein BG653_06703 [Streptomyces platensis]